MSTFVTVVVPVYNIEEQYLRRCIDSIRNQTYANFELILVDDGSTDGSGAVVDEYGRADSRIKVIHKENGGSSSARNMAISVAAGEYLSFIDSDDYIDSDFLEKLLAPIENAKKAGNPVPKIVQIGRDEIDANGTKLPDICVPPVEDTWIDNKAFFTSLIMHTGDCSFCTKLTAKSLFDGKEFPVGKLNEDFRLLVQMLMECDGVLSLPEYKYHVFYRLESNSRKKDKNNFSRVYLDCVENADLVEKLVLQKWPDLSQRALRFALYQRLEYLLHIPIAYMRKDYEGYPQCVSYIRKHFIQMIFNKYLSAKNKVYLTLFCLAPKGIRKIHARIKHL